MNTTNLIQLRSERAQRELTDAERLRMRMSHHLRRGCSMAEAERIAAQELKLSYMVQDDCAEISGELLDWTEK